MKSQPLTILTPALVANLAATAKPRAETSIALQDALAELSTLPASSIVRASYEIPAAARLGWQPLTHRLISAEPIFVRDLALMRRNPDYAWLFLFHPDGRVREAALDAIQTPPTSPFFLSALFWRLNDWAKPVRVAAERCLHRVEQRISPDVAASTAPYLLDRRYVWARWGTEADLLDHIFGRKGVLATLVPWLRREANGSLGKYLRHALRYDAIDEHLPILAAAAIQPQVRAIAYQCLLTNKASWVAGFEWIWIDKIYNIKKRVPKFESRPLPGVTSSPDLFWQAAHDRSVIVRRVAADMLIAAASPVPDADRLIAHLAEDESQSVRSRADYLRRRAGSG
jgi:hypothetical protein